MPQRVPQIKAKVSAPRRAPQIVWLVLVCAALCVLALWLPSQSFLPAVSLLACIVCAGLVGAALLMRAEHGGARVTLWDTAGALLLIGAAAGVFSEPLQVAQFFGTAVELQR